MDAVNFIVTRDRMCKSLNGQCNGCEVNERMGVDDMCIYYMAQHPQEVVEIVEQWGKEHPLKTRQSEFLKMFPKAKIKKSVLPLCPMNMNFELSCPKGNLGYDESDCYKCQKEFWSKEIE